MAVSLCAGCKRIAEVAHIEDGTERPFCASCSAVQPLTPEEQAVVLLTASGSPFGPSFADGDKVEARAGAVLYEGVGTVAGMSMSLEHGATAIYPTFKVVFAEKAYEGVPDEAWSPECALTKVEAS